MRTFSGNFCSRLALSVMTLGISFVSVAARAQSFTSFDAPGAGKSHNQGTLGTAINKNGVIIGYYIDGSGGNNSFVRGANGVITDFSVPSLIYSFASGINASGQIVGYGVGASTQGYLRKVNGSILLLNVPGYTSTVPYDINNSGVIAGECDNSSYVLFAFTRDAGGHYTVFSDPDAASGTNQGTHANSINASGQVAGYYIDVNFVYHGFVRDAAGTITNFDPAGSIQTIPVSINTSGEVTGYYIDAANLTHGFLRDASGNITSFDAPGASAGTYPNSINDSGSIVGELNQNSIAFFGFERLASGSISAFSALPPNHTAAAGINSLGHITGYYVDAGNVFHGFVK